MSETETAPQGGPTGEPAAQGSPTSRLGPDDDTTTAPAPAADTGAATEAEPNAETTDETPKPDKIERRLAAMRARLTAAEQNSARMATELEAVRRGASALDPDRPVTPEDIPRIVEERVAAEVARRAAQERAERFHEAGRKAHADWTERCSSLMQMGADAQLAEMLIELPEGARVAGALADDPEALERIAAIKTERGRAISLGMYAAALESKPTPPVRRPSNAPAPIRPLNGGQARAEFNEYTATPEQLRDYYDMQAKRARGLI